MRAVVQRVSSASVAVDGEVVGVIAEGLCVLLGVLEGDEVEDAKWMARKVCGLRIFSDEHDKMNDSVMQRGGAVLAISQFTLAGDARKGNRPSFAAAMAPEPARALFEEFCSALRGLGATCETGRFQTDMKVTLTNDGPVTISLDSKRGA